MPRVAINGFGRIGRAAFRLVDRDEELEVVAVNDLAPSEELAYLLRHDTVYGRYEKEVRQRNGTLQVGERSCEVLSEKDPSRLPWKRLDVDLVFECTGHFRESDELRQHLKAGARHVVLSAPAKTDDVPTAVYGVNEPAGDAEVVSCASCTTNCIAPVVEVLDRRIGLAKAVMTTVHAYTGSQSIVDGPNRRTRRGRAAAQNLVPSSTGAARATTRALPALGDRFDGVAVRGPVPAGSLADVVAVVRRPTSVGEVNRVFREETGSARYEGILGVTDEPLVSSDIVGDARASILDLDLTRVVGDDLVQVMSWYDNEWGYAAQMVRTARHVVGLPSRPMPEAIRARG